MFVGEHIGAAGRDQCYVAGLGLHPVERVLDHRPGAVEHRGGQRAALWRAPCRRSRRCSRGVDEPIGC
jgi:hypothetical protein